MKFIYLHGLNGSSDSVCAEQLKTEGMNLICPDLPDNPNGWYTAIMKLIDTNSEYTIIGNSTGGLFANYICQKYGFNCVLINPLITASDLYDFIGDNINRKTGSKWILTKDDIGHLKRFEVKKTISPTAIFLGTDDEILNHSNVINRYRGCCQIVKSKQGHCYRLTPSDIDLIKSMEFTMPL